MTNQIFRRNKKYKEYIGLLN